MTDHISPHELAKVLGIHDEELIHWTVDKLRVPWTNNVVSYEEGLVIFIASKLDYIGLDYSRIRQICGQLRGADCGVFMTSPVKSIVIQIHRAELCDDFKLKLQEARNQ